MSRSHHWRNNRIRPKVNETLANEEDVELSDKEEDFIDRAHNPKLSSRLACQCEVLEDGDFVVTIPDQSLMIGH